MNEEEDGDLTEIEIGIDTNTVEIAFIESLSKCQYISMLLLFIGLEVGCILLGFCSPVAQKTITQEYNIYSNTTTIPSIYRFSANKVHTLGKLRLIVIKNDHGKIHPKLKFNGTMYITRNDKLEAKELPTEILTLSFKPGHQSSSPLTVTFPNFDEKYRAVAGVFSFNSDMTWIQRILFEYTFDDAKYLRYVSRVNRNLMFSSLYALVFYSVVTYGNVIEISQTTHFPLLLFSILSFTSGRVSEYAFVIFDFCIKFKISRELLKQNMYAGIFLAIECLLACSFPGARCATYVLYACFMAFLILASRSSRPRTNRYKIFVLFGIASAIIALMSNTQKYPHLIAYRATHWLIGIYMTLCEVTVRSDTRIPVEFRAL